MFRLAKGCEICKEGAKLVVFVTGICDKNCFYCPISEKRRGKDIAWANERPIKKNQDIILEAKRMRAKGAGVTGGEPLLRVERCIEFISLLKKEFGESFHIHLYTAHAPSLEVLKKLKDAGLNEIRYHLIEEKQWKSIENAIKIKLATGIEIPVFPGKEEDIVKIALKLEKLGGNFLNLNELEFSDTNAEELLKRGYEIKSETSYAVKGSEETALKVLKKAKEINLSLPIHYCTSSYKDATQLRKRLIRTAKNIAKPYEEVTRDGLLFKGVIEIKNPSLKKLEKLRRILIRDYEIPEELIALDIEKNRLETLPEIATMFSKKYRCFLVEEYPTYDRLEVEKIPL